MSDFSTNLKALRKRADLSQDTLAEQLCVSRQTVSSWERGKSYPDLDMLVHICEALHATPNELLYPSVKKSSPSLLAFFNASLFRNIAALVFFFGFLLGIREGWQIYQPAPNTASAHFVLTAALAYWWKPFLIGSGFMGIAKILTALGDRTNEEDI